MILPMDKTVQREVIHWLWLWMLAAILISLLQRYAFGETSGSTPQDLFGPTPSQELYDRTPANDSLRDVLRMHRLQQHENAIEGWTNLRVTSDSATWKHVGIGVAHLRLENLDQALDQFSRAVQLDPENAVAEYFLGRVAQAEARKVPFWYDQPRDTPYRLAILNARQVDPKSLPRRPRGEVFLPHYRTLPLDKQAKMHFRRAVQLAEQCNLDRPIRVEQATLQLVRYDPNDKPITVRDLLIALGEEDFVDQARDEIGERLVHSISETVCSAAWRGVH